MELDWEVALALGGLLWFFCLDVAVSETLWVDSCEGTELVNSHLESCSSGSLWIEVLVDEMQELDCSDADEEDFKDSSFFFRNLSFFSALFLCLISSFSSFSSSTNCDQFTCTQINRQFKIYNEKKV